MTLSERIRLAMSEAGMSQVELARKVGIAPPSVHGWLTGKAKFLRGENLLRAAAALNVNQHWLATGEGNPHDPETPVVIRPILGAEPVQIADPEDPKQVAIQKVKLKLSAGITGFAVEPDRRDGGLATVPRRWVDKHDYIPSRLLAIEVKGESMEPSLYDGDTVVINTADTKPIDGAVYAFNYEGEPVVKRLSRDAGRWWLASDNPDQRKYHRKLCEGQDCIIVGKVVRKESERI
jgi:phage repressor protein C with HTH and peptisase S24 domain